MLVSGAEKLILLMLSDLHDKVGLESFDTNFIRSAITSDNAWALNWEMPELSADFGDTPQVAIDVVDYMFMWGVIEDSWHSISENGRAEIAKQNPFGNNVRFPGFHSDAESKEYAVAKLFVDDMGRFERYKGRDLNSHVPMCEQYKKMHQIFDRIEAPSSAYFHLSSSDLLGVLTAGVS